MATITIPPSSPPRKLWLRAEYEALSSSGVLGNQRLELIEGELIDKMGKKRAHVNSVTLLAAWLVSVFGVRFVNAEAPIDVAPEDNPSNEPEPDLIVLRRDISHFTAQQPRPEDLHLVVEVSDTTLAFDLTKAMLYARARIQEYWVLDVAAQRLIVHRNPVAGRYGSILAYSADATVSPLASPSFHLRVGDVFVTPASD